MPSNYHEVTRHIATVFYDFARVCVCVCVYNVETKCAPGHFGPSDDVDPEVFPSRFEPADLRTPRAIMQLASVLDSILSLEPQTDLPSLRALQEGGVATGTTADFRDLNPQDLSLLSGNVAILSHRLAQQAAAQQEIPDDLDG